MRWDSTSGGGAGGAKAQGANMPLDAKADGECPQDSLNNVACILHIDLHTAVIRLRLWGVLVAASPSCRMSVPIHPAGSYQAEDSSGQNKCFHVAGIPKFRPSR
jgi:hypothetical protein